MATKTRGQETVRDMVLSLLVLLGGVAVVVALLPRGHHSAITVVATGETVRSFAGQAPYQPFVPKGLPGYWKATSVHATVPVDGNLTGGNPTGSPEPGGGSGGHGVAGANAASLSIGYVVDRSASHRTFAEFDQTNASAAVDQLLPARGGVVGSLDAGGASWQVRRDSAGHLALTRAVAGVTLVVSDGGGKGGAAQSDLRVLAASLTQANPSNP